MSTPFIFTAESYQEAVRNVLATFTILHGYNPKVNNILCFFIIRVTADNMMQH
ncbi:hypothetical protein J2S19_005011 [Metabacillus malikii]|uniref:Uncharacterized protein n=1 Tax=Metabacillus malikii TaxID=1504265 RepID=A0ABT9ZMZ5_9BACI|nr:hypothetical protein [Metabacillus malikii]